MALQQSTDWLPTELPVRITLIIGGPSAEHEVSIVSGLQALRAVRSAKYLAQVVYWGKTGGWWTGSELETLSAYQDIPSLMKKSDPVDLNFTREKKWLYSRKSILSRENYQEVIWPILHGGMGENGAIQGLIEILGFPYIGPRHTFAAVGMSKMLTKRVASALKIPVLPDVIISRSDTLSTVFTAMKNTEIKLPVILKPDVLGSSIGIHIAHTKVELERALEVVQLLADRTILEPFHAGAIDLNISVLGIGPTEQDYLLSPIERPIKSDELLSFEDKYLRGSGEKLHRTQTEGMASASREIPAKISASERKQIEQIARTLAVGLQATGVFRIDTLKLPTGKIVMNEINTIPGSNAFYLWEAQGLSYPNLIQRLVLDALKIKTSSPSVLNEDHVEITPFLQSAAGEKLSAR